MNQAFRCRSAIGTSIPRGDPGPAPPAAHLRFPVRQHDVQQECRGQVPDGRTALACWSGLMDETFRRNLNLLRASPVRTEVGVSGAAAPPHDHFEDQNQTSMRAAGSSEHRRDRCRASGSRAAGGFQRTGTGPTLRRLYRRPPTISCTAASFYTGRTSAVPAPHHAAFLNTHE